MNTFQIMQEVWRGAYGRTRVMAAGFLTILFSLTIAVWFQCNAASVNDKFTIASLFVVVSIIISAVFIYPLIARHNTAQDLPVDLREYFNPWASTLIWFAVVTGGLYLFPVQQHPWMAGTIIIGVSIIVLAFVWGKTPSWARTSIYYGSIAVVVGAIMYFTLALTLKPLFGINLMSTPGDREIVATQERIEEANKAAAAVALLIPEKQRTAEQKALIAQYAGDVSVLSKTKKLFHTDEAQASAPAQKIAQTEPVAAPAPVREIHTVEVRYIPAPPAEKMAATPAPAPAATEVWNVRWIRNGQLLEEDFQLTRNGNTVTMSAPDGTELDLNSGIMTVHGKYAGPCQVNLSGWNGSGWWNDTEKINLTLRRLS